jgi:alginate O-acetyltransferase complex protein AlgI
MIFSSIIFLVFFLPIVFTIYYLSHNKFKNRVLLLASMLFYAWGAPKFIFVLLPLTAIDFLIVKKMYALTPGRKKQLWLAASVCLNLGLLMYFKYCNFFIDNANVVLTKLHITNIEWTKIVLPIGISFFCFETLTYSIDAYRKVIKPLQYLHDYYLYIFFFPKLIAGPIVRFNVLEHQISAQNRSTNSEYIIDGFWRFCLGLSKKVLIANTMAQFADTYLNADLAALNTTTAWLAMLAYTMQIYFDFSGYSDMALGLAKMLGFNLPENFENPYTSKNITEFWRKWHISLGAWMKEYLYIPLGGNKVNYKWQMYLNLWLVFLISGLWHGASWNFVIWGAFHGIFLILDRLFLIKLTQKLGAFVATVSTFGIVVVGWVFFRMNTFYEAKQVIKKLIAFDFKTIELYANREFFTVFVIAILFSFLTSFTVGQKIQNAVYFNKRSANQSLLLSAVGCILFIVCVARITSSDFNPFIYFRF